MSKKAVPTKDDEFAVVLDKNVTVQAFNYITNNSSVGENTIVSPFNDIKQAKLGKDCVIKSSTILQSEVFDEVNIGPHAHLRPNSKILKNAKIGNFVEVKNSTVGEHSKASHMSYIGDGVIGKHTNIGCGTIFCNYDGKTKHKTIVGDNVFIGSNVNLVAPIEIGDNAIVGAGSTLTQNVPKDALSIARAYQVNKLNYKRKE